MFKKLLVYVILPIALLFSLVGNVWQANAESGAPVQGFTQEQLDAAKAEARIEGINSVTTGDTEVFKNTGRQEVFAVLEGNEICKSQNLTGYGCLDAILSGNVPFSGGGSGGQVVDSGSLPDQGGSRTHIVATNDTLSAIASQYSVNMYELAALNGLSDPYTVFLGQTLLIPESVSTFSGSSSFVLEGPQFQVVKAIMGPVGYSKDTEEDPAKYPWPAEWTTVSRPKFEHINGEAVWRSQDVLPGEVALYVGSGIQTPKGHFEGCSGGWFRNGTDVTITIWVKSMSEIVVGDSDNYDAMAQELALRTSSGNQCETSYLAQIPLH